MRLHLVRLSFEQSVARVDRAARAIGELSAGPALIQESVRFQKIGGVRCRIVSCLLGKAKRHLSAGVDRPGVVLPANDRK